jgi:hypothetical protein
MKASIRVNGPTRDSLGDWGLRHNAAVDRPQTRHELAIVTLCKAAEAYALAHREKFSEGSEVSLVAEDGVLGPAWLDIVHGIRALLNGETGSRLDCGTLDRFLCDLLAEHGAEGMSR